MKKSVIAIILCIFLVGCSDAYSDTGETETVATSETNAESEETEAVIDNETDVDDSISDTTTLEVSENPTELAEEATEDNTGELSDEASEDENEPETSNEDVEYTVHENAGWAPRTVGPISFEGPKKWEYSSSRFYDGAMYFPEGTGKDKINYSMSVGINENLTVDSFVNRDLGQYEDVDYREGEIDGHHAVCMDYFHTDIGSDDEIFTSVLYIELTADKGVGIVTYDATIDNPEAYLADFYRLVDSITIGDTQEEPESPKEYVLNVSTGTFHEESCYKVKQIENKKYISGTRDELIAQGYKACEICDPR